ncbi:MAG: hypothetical protein HY328_15070 [Chloroflexi bacterium]|nr:hypothetical protein [Chloroflexota bacterium]
MNKQRIPQTDSIQELAEFWDTHDVTDFEDELEEVTEPIFVRSGQASIRLPLTLQDWKRLRELAIDKGTTDVALAQEWVLEKLKAA